MMSSRQPYSVLAYSILLLAGLTFNCGCSGDNGDPAATLAAASIRSQTPDEVVERFNQAHINELVDVSTIVAMMHAENAWQAGALDTIRRAMPVYELDAVMRAEYATPLELCPLESLFAPLAKPASIADQQDASATATYLDTDATARTLYLVKHDGAWFISAATLENEPNIKQGYDTGTLLAMNRTFNGIHDNVPSLINSLKSGEYRSGNAAKKAILDAAQRR